MSAANRQLVERLMSGLNAENSGIIEEIYAADAEVDWPQFGIRIIGAADRRKAFETLEIKPDVHPRRIYGEGNVWVIEAMLSYDGHDVHSISVLEIQAGQIVRETSYWSEPKYGKAGWQPVVDPAAIARFVHPLDAIARVPEPEELEVQ